MRTTINIYLKTMYLLEQKYDNIRVTDIAEKLNYTKSSVSKALKRLNEKGLIKYESYGDIILTNKARKEAEKLMLKEDLLELFFVGMLNISEKQALEDINVISDYVSDETKDKLKKYIKESLHLETSSCKCSGLNCEVCETKKIQNRVSSNSKWLEILKEQK